MKWVCTLLAQYVGAESQALAMPAKSLTLQQLQQIHATNATRVDLTTEAFTHVFIDPHVPPPLTWVDHRDLAREAAGQTYSRFEYAANDYTDQLALYYFGGGRPITERFVCYESFECTIVATWDGHRWRSRLTEHSSPHPILRARPAQVGVVYSAGRLSLIHTFPGPRARWLVFNEAVYASGQLTLRRCGFFRRCHRAVLKDYLRLNKLFPVGIAGFHEHPLSFDR